MELVDDDDDEVPLSSCQPVATLFAQARKVKLRAPLKPNYAAETAPLLARLDYPA